MTNYEAIVAALAKAAFTLHYDATRRPDWATAEQHWRANPGARELWSAIVTGVLVGAERAGAPALPQNAASGLLARVTRPGGPMTPLPDPNRGRTFVGPGDMTPVPVMPRQPARGPAQPLPLPETPPKLVPGDPGPFPDDPRPDFKEDPKGYRKWKARNFGRIYGGPVFGSQRATNKPEAASLLDADYAELERKFAGDVPPGLAIERHDCQPLPISPYLDATPPEAEADEPSPEEREAERSKLARDD